MAEWLLAFVEGLCSMELVRYSSHFTDKKTNYSAYVSP